MNNKGRTEGMADVVIIGGGASGLAAAIELGMKSPELDVVVIEKNSEPGRKIRATGSGRCNISNTGAEGYEEIMDFFDRIGLVTRAYDNGLVYPYSESAKDAADLLYARACEAGSRFILDAEVTSIKRMADTYLVSYTPKSGGGRPEERHIRADKVILAAGGKAGPSYGTTGDGYRIARELGHSIVTPVPVLTACECTEWNVSGSKSPARDLAGTRTRGIVTLYKKSHDHTDDEESCGQPGMQAVFTEAGEIQFTREGISGICIFNMTRHMRLDRTRGESMDDFTVSLDLYPDRDIRDHLRRRRELAPDGEIAGDILSTVLKSNIASYVIDTAADACAEDIRGMSVRELDDACIEALGSAVHSLTFHPSGLRGWKEAQATSGGVSLDEIDANTCESLIAPGIYITGELADRDYPCGGFNLSNAWLTGLRAARSIAGFEQIQIERDQD